MCEFFQEANKILCQCGNVIYFRTIKTTPVTDQQKAKELKKLLDRSENTKRLEENTSEWDIVIIGGGATGLGIAVDAASRGLKTLLLEQSDFAKGTSSRSTKLIHGGVRYLAQGDIGLVYSALRERGLLLNNAAHVVKKQFFFIPCYSVFEKIKYLAGLKLYDLLAIRYSLGKSKFINREDMLAHFPNIQAEKLIGGVQYFDGQFDDARLAVNIAQTAVQNSAVVLNYFKVTGINKQNGKT